VLEVIRAVERVTGRAVPFHTAPRRAGDPATLVAAAGSAGPVLGFAPRHLDIHDIVASADAFERRRRGI
jgi:UDP-glucose 4-epimerase